jgi:hypothetical protein
MKNKNLTIWIIIGVFILLFIIILVIPSNRYLFRGPICSEKADMTKLDLNAVAVDKFKDSLNHNYPTILFQDIKSKSKFKVYFINERSGFFNIIVIGDSVIKKPGSLELWTSNKNIKAPFSFDCKEDDSN